MPVVPATQEAKVKASWLEAIWGKVSGKPYRKNKLKTKMTGDVGQVVEHFSSKLEVPSSNPRIEQ
jgi:hypothetical protein